VRMAREAVLRFNGSSFQLFTPLESPSIYARDGGNRKHQLLIERGQSPALSLTGFTSFFLFC
jgi:hypothetical protein